MALRIRLRRMGRKKAPHYRIVVAESSMPRDGRFVETIGHYNPRTQPKTIVVNRDKALEWLGKGATATDTVQTLFKRSGVYSEEATPVETMIHKVREAAEGVTETVADTAAGAAGAVKKAAAGAAETVAEAASDAAEAVSEAAGKAAAKAREVAEDVAHAVARDDAEPPQQPAAEADAAEAEADEAEAVTAEAAPAEPGEADALNQPAVEETAEAEEPDEAAADKAAAK